MFGKKPELTIDFVFHRKISRLFIFRFLWLVIAIWPLALLGIWFAILSFVQFWHMLILGERSEAVWVKQIGLIRFFATWQAYLKYFIDTRPTFWIGE